MKVFCSRKKYEFCCALPRLAANSPPTSVVVMRRRVAFEEEKTLVASTPMTHRMAFPALVDAFASKSLEPSATVEPDTLKSHAACDVPTLSVLLPTATTDAPVMVLDAIDTNCAAPAPASTRRSGAATVCDVSEIVEDALIVVELTSTPIAVDDVAVPMVNVAGAVSSVVPTSVELTRALSATYAPVTDKVPPLVRKRAECTVDAEMKMRAASCDAEPVPEMVAEPSEKTTWEEAPVITALPVNAAMAGVCPFDVKVVAMKLADTADKTQALVCHTAEVADPSTRSVTPFIDSAVDRKVTDAPWKYSPSAVGAVAASEADDDPTIDKFCELPLTMTFDANVAPMDDTTAAAPAKVTDTDVVSP